MKPILKLALCSAALASCGTLRAEVPLQAFTADTLEQIEARHEGEDFLLVLWSVQCAPCLAELALVAATPGLPIELVSTDAPALRDDVEASLERYGLATRASWQFADELPERLRFRIDPTWYGELPRSYFYDAAGERHGYSGALTPERMQDWQHTPVTP